MVRRIRVTAGPWPERIGCTGQVVDGPDHYPWHGLPKGELVVLLDDDPLRCDQRGSCDHEPGSFTCTLREPPWSCCISRKHLEAICSCPCHTVIQPGLIPCPSCATSPDHSSRSVRALEGLDSPP